MAYTSWRGMVGVIKPTKRPGVLEEFIRLLPEGVGVIPTFLGVYGTHKEFAEAMKHYDRHIAELAEQRPDLVIAGGEPPFMLLGVKGEAEIARKWEKKYKVDILTTGRNVVDACKAVKMKNVVGIRATNWDTRNDVVKYFNEAGFNCQGFFSIDTDWEGISNISAEQVYAFTKKTVLAQKKCDGIYMMGSIFRALHVIEMLEQDLGIPTVSAHSCYPWAIRKRLHIRDPLQGYGTLLRDLP